jgi:hypothetical protein
MNTLKAHSLEDVIRQAGEGWLIDRYTPPSEAMNAIRQALREVGILARGLANAAPDLSEDAIIAEFQRRPLPLRGFFQAFAGTRTPEMILMAWRIIQGWKIKRVTLDYKVCDTFKLSVVIESPEGVEDPPYETTNINDFTLFRHVGILVASGRPVFDGFYPLRVD